MPFVVAATWIARAGEEQGVLQIIQTMTPLSRAESGNLYYQAQVSPDAPGTFLLYEQYVDAAGYESHKASPHFQQYVVNHALELLASREVKTFVTIED